MREKTLIVYYSATGNTQTIAERIQKATGFEMVRLETKIPYPKDYYKMVSQGEEEVNNRFKPELKPLQVNVSDYSKIIVGTPTWWYSMAPAMLSFLSIQKWKGKTVIPFMTNAGWPGHVIDDMKAVCEGASFMHEKEIRFSASEDSRNQMKSSESEIKKWIDSLNE